MQQPFWTIPQHKKDNVENHKREFVLQRNERSNENHIGQKKTHFVLSQAAVFALSLHPSRLILGPLNQSKRKGKNHESWRQKRRERQEKPQLSSLLRGTIYQNGERAKLFLLLSFVRAFLKKRDSIIFSPGANVEKRIPLKEKVTDTQLFSREPQGSNCGRWRGIVFFCEVIILECIFSLRQKFQTGLLRKFSDTKGTWTWQKKKMTARQQFFRKSANQWSLGSCTSSPKLIWYMMATTQKGYLGPFLHGNKVHVPFWN